MRYNWIDIARLLFAFLVVVVHVPLLGSCFIKPITSLAVPFFYVTTGFFIWDEEKKKLETKLCKSLKKYAKLWASYFLILTGLCWILKFTYNNNFEFNVEQLVDLFYTYGNCSLVDVVVINEKQFGISALWFLYGGTISIGIMYVCRQHLLKMWFKLLVVVLWIAYIVINNKQQTIYIPRTIGASLPYIYAGIVLKHGIDNIKITLPKCLTTLLVLGILLYAEVLLFHPIGYAKLMLLPTIAVFFYILTQFRGGEIIKKIPLRTSLDIYIWHRFVYIVLAGICGLYLYNLDSVVIFIVILITSFSIRTINHNTKQGKD